MNVILNVKNYNGGYCCFSTICGYDHFEESNDKHIAISKMRELAIKVGGLNTSIIVNDKTVK